MEAKKHKLGIVFSEDTRELFSGDEDTGKFLQLSSFGLMNCRCLIKRNGSKASSYKGTQFSQLYKIMEKIAYRTYEEDTFSCLAPIFVLNIQKIYLIYLLLRMEILEVYNHSVTLSIPVALSIKLGY